MYGAPVRAGGPLLAVALAGTGSVPGAGFLADAIGTLADLSSVVVTVYLGITVFLVALAITVRVRVRMVRPAELDEAAVSSLCPAGLMEGGASRWLDVGRHLDRSPARLAGRRLTGDPTGAAE